MAEIIKVPLAALRAIEGIYAFQSPKTEDEMLDMLENIIYRFNIPLDDPYDLWNAYMDWQTAQNQLVTIH